MFLLMEYGERGGHQYEEIRALCHTAQECRHVCQYKSHAQDEAGESATWFNMRVNIETESGVIHHVEIHAIEVGVWLPAGEKTWFDSM